MACANRRVVEKYGTALGWTSEVEEDSKMLHQWLVRLEPQPEALLRRSTSVMDLEISSTADLKIFSRQTQHRVRQFTIHHSSRSDAKSERQEAYSLDSEAG